MSRARSKTVDSAEVKKKGIPRRLNEKIALMKEKEQAQSEAFEQAMKSIFEMQQARLHGGGGSMPSLQAIDTNQSFPPNAFPVTMDSSGCLTTPTLTHRDRPHSGGSGGRSSGIERTQSCDTNHQINSLRSPNSPQFWNIANEWSEADLARHKSDSDLQQSLLENPSLYQVCSPPSVPGAPHVHISYNLSEQQLPKTTMTSKTSDITMWSGPQSPTTIGSSVSAALLSPDYGVSGSDVNSMGGASSLPDLTNVEFSCGLDVPLEDDDPPLIPNVNSFHYSGPGPSKLMHSTMQALPPIQVPPNVSPFNIITSHNANMSHPLLPRLTSPPITRSPTMPDFRVQQQYSAPLLRKFKPIVPAGTNPGHHGYQPSGYPYHPEPFFSFGQKAPPNISLPSPQEYHHPNSLSLQTTPPSDNTFMLPPYMTLSGHLPSVTVDTSMLLNDEMSNSSKQHSISSNINSGYTSLPPYLDPGLSYQRQALQQKMASMNVNAPPLRSHSEENLIKILKEGTKTEEVQHNPFMGNMSNASSVPCVYVEPTNTEPCITDQPDSPTTGTGSPSTSASHASSPPLSRPSWIDQPHSMNDYVFHEWPMDPSANVDKTKFGSPLSHHKSLTELNKLPTDYVMDLSPSSQAKAHQLSLPSIVMNDLIAMDESLDKHMETGAFLPADFEMEEEVMQSLLRDDGFVSFDVSIGPILGDPPDFIQQKLNF